MKSSNKDITITAKNSTYYFRFLAWDTNFFGIPSYLLDTKKSNMQVHTGIVFQIKTRFDNTFVSAKVDAALDYRIFSLLFESGFQYIDTEITLQHLQSTARSTFDKKIIIKRLRRNEGLPYEKLGTVYSLTRFHTDPHIPAKKADQLWVHYLRNFILDDHHQMLAAYLNNDIAGIILIESADIHARISFISVRKCYQNMNIGSLLLQEVARNFKEKPLLAGTQIKNVKAINFYIRNGFSKIYSTKTILHRW
jgi:GNAT superfamily N-acetyltransferase